MPMNRRYEGAHEMPAVIPVFPLTAALLLPRGQMPLNIFEPRYLAMIDAALKGERLIGMVQPMPGTAEAPTRCAEPALCEIGCTGRITAFQETGDGRYLVTLTGVARFRILEELEVATPYRQCRVTSEPFAQDFTPRHEEDRVDRPRLLRTFRAYLEANSLEADWESVGQACNETLVNALSMMSPYGAREKQALLEAQDLRERAEMLIAMTEMVLARGESVSTSQLQ